MVLSRLAVKGWSVICAWLKYTEDAQIDACSQDEFRRRKRAGQHIPFQCRNCIANDQRAAEAAVREEAELRAEEFGLLPVGPVAVPVEDAAQPAVGPAQVLEALGAPADVRDVGPPAPGNPQPLPHRQLEPVQRGPRVDAPVRPHPRLYAVPPVQPAPAPVTFSYLPNGSKRGKPLVVSSDGYSYAYVSISSNAIMKYGHT